MQGEGLVLRGHGWWRANGPRVLGLFYILPIRGWAHKNSPGFLHAKPFTRANKKGALLFSLFLGTDVSCRSVADRNAISV